MSTLDKIDIKRKKSKKALSIMIGYVLLVTFGIVLGVIIYSWMKTYVPKDSLNCPEGSSLSIESYNYDCNTKNLTLVLKNNGQFDIKGYFIYGTDSPEKQLANIDLSNNNSESGLRLNPGIMFTANPLGPGETEKEEFNHTGSAVKIYSLEIVPIRNQTEKRKSIIVSCVDSRIKQEISCSVPCIPDDPIAVTCSGRECGRIMNNCYNYVSCGLGCFGGEVCNSTGRCVLPEVCNEDCASLGYECGTWEICGVPGVSCDNPGCDVDEYCDEGLGRTGKCLPIVPLNCDGTWNPPEQCDGTPHCTNCVCDPPYIPNGAGVCVDSIGNGICDPWETCAQEPVACEGHQALCPEGEICISGECEPIDESGIGCTNYCISLLLGYTSSTCVGAAGQCWAKYEGFLKSGGDYLCGGTLLCCCIP